MRRFWTAAIAALVLAGGAVSSFAQEDSMQQAKLKEKRAAKLAESWVTATPWITDFDAAQAKSKETGKPIFGYFSRSYSP
jgi:predicted methyltransferase